MFGLKLIIRKMLKGVKNNNQLFMLTQYLLYGLVRLLFSTYRLAITYDPAFEKDPGLKSSPGIFYFWHQHLLGGMFFFSRLQCVGHCIISPSKDGLIATFIAKKLNFSVLHGSPHKTPVLVVRQALQVLREEGRLCLIGDGSRGPAFVLQDGIRYLSHKTQIPLVFIECNPRWAYTSKKSWDQCKIPLPFTTIDIRVHAPRVTDCSRLKE